VGVTACVIGQREHPAAAGYLCLGHLERLGVMLRDIEEESIHLDARPSMAIRTGSGKGSLASERAPVRLDVLAFRDPRTRRWEPDKEPAYVPPQPKRFGPWCLFCEHESCMAWRAGRRRDLHDDEHDAGSDRVASVLDELHNWARLVREERELNSPDHVTLTGERALLTRQLDWCAEQPWIDEFYTDMKALLSQLQSVNGTLPEKPVGRCYLPAEAGECGGPIWMDVVLGEARCGACGASWTGHQLAMLNFELERAQQEAVRPRTPDGRRMLTAGELAQKLGTTVGNVRVMAHRDHVTAVDGHYDPDLFRRGVAEPLGDVV
jgi:hypothetical protein